MDNDDLDLMRRLGAGDERAVAGLLDRHWADLVRYAHSLLGDWDGAEDVTQAAFVRLWASRDRWADGSSAALLYTITRNAALDVLKSPRRSARSDLPEALEASGDPEGDAALAELGEAVRSAVESLPPRRREVFLLVRERGFSYEEVAGITRLSRQTVANHMSLALSDLRTMLAAFLPAALRAHDRASALASAREPARRPPPACGRPR